MPNRVDALMKAVQNPPRDSALYGVSPDPGSIQLPASDYAVLPPSHLADRWVYRDSRRTARGAGTETRAKDAFPAHAPGNAVFVAHPADGLVRDRTCGARFEPKASTGAQKRPQPAVAASGFDPFK
jgi:hypothetical protein